jgi:molybdate transport system substrate-binding protein
MHKNWTITRRALLLGGALLLSASLALADEIRVISSGGFTAAYKQLVPLYEQASGHKVITSYGASIGNAPDSIPSRLARGEQFDILILSGDGLDKLVQLGHVVPGSRVDLGVMFQ